MDSSVQSPAFPFTFLIILFTPAIILVSGNCNVRCLHTTPGKKLFVLAELQVRPNKDSFASVQGHFVWLFGELTKYFLETGLWGRSTPVLSPLVASRLQVFTVVAGLLALNVTVELTVLAEIQPLIFLKKFSFY